VGAAPAMDEPDWPVAARGILSVAFDGRIFARAPRTCPPRISASVATLRFFQSFAVSRGREPTVPPRFVVAFPARIRTNCPPCRSVTQAQGSARRGQKHPDELSGLHKELAPSRGPFLPAHPELTGSGSVVRTDDPEGEPVRVRRALDEEQGAGARERRRRREHALDLEVTVGRQGNAGRGRTA
jgi:hypothetical protein